MATGDLSGLHGTVHGKTIVLAEDPGLPDGQKVSVIVQPILAPGEGLRRSFGGWSGDDEAGLDAYLAECRKARQVEARELES